MTPPNECTNKDEDFFHDRADWNCCNHVGCKPLHDALVRPIRNVCFPVAADEIAETVHVLLDHKADMGTKSYFWFVTIEIATYRHRQSTIILFTE